MAWDEEDFDEDEDKHEDEEQIATESDEEHSDFDDMESEETSAEYEPELGLLGKFFKKIKDSELGQAVSGAKTSIDKLISEAHAQRSKNLDIIKEKLFGGNEEVSEVLKDSTIVREDDGGEAVKVSEKLQDKDILFNSMKIKAHIASKRRSEQLAARKAEKDGYVLGAVLKELTKLKREKRQLEEEKKKIYDNQDIEVNKKKKQLEEAQKNIDEFDPQDKAAKDEKGIIAAALKRRAAYLRAKDTEEGTKKVPKGIYEEYDYEGQALKEALGQAKDDESRKILQQYQKNRMSERDIVAGITQALETFGKQRDEEQKIVDKAEGKDKEILQGDLNKKFSNTVAEDRAAAVALERAQKEAEYLRAHDDSANEEENQKEDYVETALNNAKKEADPAQKVRDIKVLDIIEKAKTKHSENKQKAEADEAKRKEEQEKADREKYDEKSRIDKALAEKRAKRKEIEYAKEAAKRAEGVTPGMAAYYDEQLKKIDAEMAEIALRTIKEVTSEREERARKAAQAAIDEQKRKLEEKETKKKKEIDDARKRAEAKIAEEAKKKQEEEEKKKAKTDADAGTQTPQATGKTDDKLDVRYDDAFGSFLKSIGWSGKVELAPSSNVDYDDDDEDDVRKKQENEEKRQKIVTNFQKGMKHIRSLNDIKKITNARIDYIRKEIDTDSEDRKTRKRRIKVIDNLKSEVGSHFNFHGPSIVGEEANGSKGSIMYVIKLSSLLNDLHTSLSKASSMFGRGGNEGLNKMIEDLHAEQFRKFGREYLKSVQVKNSVGKDVVAFTESRESGFRSLRSGHQKNGSEGGICFMGMLRTMENVCGAQTHLASNAKSIVGDIISHCKSLLGQNPHKLSDSDITSKIQEILGKGWKSDQIQKLKSNNAGPQAQKNAEKLEKLLDLFKELAKNPSDTKTIKDIKDKLPDFNDFSDLGTGTQWSDTSYKNDLFNSRITYTFFEPKQ